MAAMITVKVRVYSALNYYLQHREAHSWFQRQLPAGSSAHKLIQSLGLPEQEVMILKINGARASNYLVR
ncbi:MAG: hypothetical protein GX952_07735 [Firmicutes bacterium]|nr:hypothetical protein [Bacillota bacterium]